MIFPLKASENIKSTVLNFIKSHRIPHAIMIEGANLKDTALLADFISSAAVCSDENAPCGNCKNCHMATVKTHPDITYVTMPEGKKNLTVGQIRDIRADAFVKPHSAEHRVFIIKDADRMNEQAQNALLKVLEEPPHGVIFILITPSKTLLLDTIVSRCVLLSLQTALEPQEDDFHEMAEKFIELLVSGSEYDMLKLLTPLEKNRLSAEKFINSLALECAKKLRIGSSLARVLDALYDDTKYYLDLLKTNINMSLFISMTVCRSKGPLNQ